MVIVITTDQLAKNNIDQTISDYSYDPANAKAIDELSQSKSPLKVSIALNITLAVFMLLNFVLSAFTLGKPLRQYRVEEEHAH